jgi:hypothetical protein
MGATATVTRCDAYQSICRTKKKLGFLAEQRTVLIPLSNVSTLRAPGTGARRGESHSADPSFWCTPHPG